MLTSVQKNSNKKSDFNTCNNCFPLLTIPCKIENDESFDLAYKYTPVSLHFQTNIFTQRIRAEKRKLQFHYMLNFISKLLML